MALDETCLFSLELVVERLYMSHIECIFPVIAFRFLDFPTIVIQHVEPTLADSIRRKLENYSYKHFPTQLSELQDSDGNFVIKRGKSCLFKASVTSLRNKLALSPLSVMIIDEFFNGAKLVASTTVSFTKTIENTYKDFYKAGESVTTVHGDKNLYRLYTLMGAEIGYVVVGHRLLCFGSNMIQHLEKKSDISNCHKTIRSESKKDLTNLNTSLCGVHNIEPAPSRMKESKYTSTDATLTNERRLYSTVMSNVSTQTTVDNMVKVVESNKLERFSDISRNCDQPPALFYQNTGEKVLWMGRITLDDNRGDVEASYSNDTDNIYDMETTKYVNNLESVDTKINISQHSDPMNSVGFKSALWPDSSPNLFPVLSGLINEIGALKMYASPVEAFLSVKSSKNDMMPSKDAHNVIDSDQRICSKCHKSSKIEKKLSEESICHHSSGRHSCTSRDDGVPKDKSWMRTTPVVSVKKSKLKFGMTNAQRLRLEMQKTRNEAELTGLKHVIPSSYDKKIQASGASAITYKKLAKSLPTLIQTPVKDIKLSDSLKNKVKISRSKIFTCSVDEQSTNMSTTLEQVVKVLENATEMNGAESIVNKDSNVDTCAIERLESDESNSNLAASNYELKDVPESYAKATTLSSSRFNEQVDDISDRNETNIINVKSFSELALLHGENNSENIVNENPPQPHTVSAKDVTHDEILSKLMDVEQNEMRGFSLQPCVELKQHPLESYDVTDRIGIVGKSLNVTDDSLPAGFETEVLPVLALSGTDDSNILKSTDEPELQDIVSDCETSQNKLSVSNVNIFDSISDEPSPDSVSAKSKSSETEKVSVVTALRSSIPNPVLSENSPIPSTRRSLAKAEWSALSRQDSSVSDSYQRPTPRPRLVKMRESVHTESLSTYEPSDADISLGSCDSYSEDFHEEDEVSPKKEGHLPCDDDINLDYLLSECHYIPSTKLGYTIN